MKQSIASTTSSILLSALILTAGCSSDDESNAITTAFDANNAESSIQTAAASASILGSSSFAAEITPQVSLQAALATIKPLLPSSTAVASGVSFSEACPGGGSISGDSTESFSGSTTTESGSATLATCVIDEFTYNGNISFNDSSDSSNGEYSSSASGSLSLLFSGGSFSFSNFSFASSGNSDLNTYTITQLSYTISFTSNDSNGGFSVALTEQIVEATGNNCPESGHITLTGANGTTAEGIYNGDDTTMTIRANGELVNPSAQCYS